LGISAQLTFSVMMEKSVMKNRVFLLVMLCVFIYSRPVLADSMKPVEAQHGMVVTEQVLASEIGAKVLRAGGNAVDAAVAVGYALAVVNPCCGNIGGSGFMLIHLKSGKNTFLNFRGRAPLAATATLFQDKTGKIIPGKSLYGYAAVGVPGTVLGLETALKKYGTLSRQKLMQPAIQLAEQGYILNAGDIKLMDDNLSNFKKSANVAAIFLQHGKPYKIGDRLIQTDLAQTLKLISAQGSDVFYKGSIAQDLVRASQANQGVLSLKDFSDYTVETLTPVKCIYHGYTIFSAPPPSSGGTTLCEILNIVETYPLKSSGFHSAQAVHDLVEAERFAFFDRNNKIADPDFVKNPVAHLISKSYAAEIRAKIPANTALSSSTFKVESAREGIHTTHYSIVDKFGNAVSVTYTLNSYFGAQVIAGDTGFLLNNDMDDFTSKVGEPNQFGLILGETNKIEPGKRPLSAMSPTIIMRGDQLVMVVGSPGGPRIITSVLQTILNVLEYNMNIQAAVDAPRFHHQWLPDIIYIEPDTFSKSVQEQLTKMGYHFSRQERWSAVEAIYIDPVTKKIYGGSDNRRAAGKAVGY
jgi:gamma-glutamyltranspeptidase/glutathione hydrolase